MEHFTIYYCKQSFPYDFRLETLMIVKAADDRDYCCERKSQSFSFLWFSFSAFIGGRQQAAFHRVEKSIQVGGTIGVHEYHHPPLQFSVLSTSVCSHMQHSLTNLNMNEDD